MAAAAARAAFTMQQLEALVWAAMAPLCPPQPCCFPLEANLLASGDLAAACLLLCQLLLFLPLLLLVQEELAGLGVQHPLSPPLLLACLSCSFPCSSSSKFHHINLQQSCSPVG